MSGEPYSPDPDLDPRVGVRRAIDRIITLEGIIVCLSDVVVEDHGQGKSHGSDCVGCKLLADPELVDAMKRIGLKQIIRTQTEDQRGWEGLHEQAGRLQGELPSRRPELGPSPTEGDEFFRRLS